MVKQQTLDAAITLEGVNVFNGKPNTITFSPAEENTGIVVVGRNKHGKQVHVHATLDSAFHAKPSYKTKLASCIGLECDDGTQFLKFDHVLPAVNELGIDNVIITLSDNVVPRFNQSIAPIIESLENSLVPTSAERNYIVPHTVFESSLPEYLNGRSDHMVIHPSEGLVITYEAGYKHKAIGEQEISIDLGSRRISKSNARAITFVSLKEDQN